MMFVLVCLSVRVFMHLFIYPSECPFVSLSIAVCRCPLSMHRAMIKHTKTMDHVGELAPDTLTHTIHVTEHTGGRHLTSTYKVKK